MPLLQSDFDYIRAFVRDQAAIVLEPGKEYLVESRLGPVARSAGLPSIAALVTEMRRQPPNGLHRTVVEAMTTNETSFFRDVSPFEAMRTLIVPELIASRAGERRLRIWCGAASTGQEPYSLAMLLVEHFPALAGWDVKIIATDISREVLDRARAGRYSQLEVNRGLPAPLLIKHFERAGTEWVIKERVRKLVQFDELNLVRPWTGLPPCDIVFLRNVLIYFDVATKRHILEGMRRVLRPDGSLFLGSAETTTNITTGFVRQAIGKASCYRLATS
jgi:chemotaxis protein methyltransferase CheR